MKLKSKKSIITGVTVVNSVLLLGWRRMHGIGHLIINHVKKHIWNLNNSMTPIGMLA